MKVDTIYKNSKNSTADYKGGMLQLKTYHYLFIIALIGVFFINGINNVYKLLHLKDEVAYATLNGYSEFIDTLENKDDFTQAKQYFLDAKKNINTLIVDNNIVGNSDIFISADRLLEVSLYLTEAASLTMEVEDIFDIFMQNIDEKKDLSRTQDKIDDAINLINKAIVLFDNVNMKQLKSRLSNEQYKYLEELHNGVYKLQDILYEIRNNIIPLNIFLGDRYPNRVLILLQNNNEIRPTGGFIGSLGFLDINDGRIESVQVKDVYDFDGQAFERDPNSEISIVSGHDFGIRDSNTSPDFAISAKNAKQFLEAAKGPGVDSVVAIDLEFIRLIMEKTGPIYIDSLDITLTAENFDIILSYFVESKTFGENTPKDILKLFLEEFKDTLFNTIELNELLEIIAVSAKEKHIQMFADNEIVQTWFEDIGVAGNLSKKRSYDDYLNVVNISVGGNKSDAFIEQDIKHESFIKSNGMILDQLTIKRRHTWNGHTELWMYDQLASVGIVHPNREIIRILGNDQNKVMTRVYIPNGSKLTGVIGIDDKEIHMMEEEINGEKVTYILFPMNTNIGEESEVILSYILPFKLDLKPIDDYRLFFDKQAGMKHVNFSKYIYYASGIRSFSTNPMFAEIEGGELYQAILHSDRILSVAVGKVN